MYLLYVMLPEGMLLVKTAESQSTQVADIESWAYKNNWGLGCFSSRAGSQTPKLKGYIALALGGQKLQ